MSRTIYQLKIGEHMITDLLDPQPSQIDLDAIEQRLRNTQRFTNNPAALNVHVHRRLVWWLARFDKQDEAVRRWCWHHDDHEGVIGDIAGPLVRLIYDHTPILATVAWRLDEAVALANGFVAPSEGSGVRPIVHFYDKAAECIEWTHVLGEEISPFGYRGYPLPSGITEKDIAEALEWARSDKPRGDY